MQFELRSPAGRLVLDELHQLRFERNGRAVLQSGACLAFVQVYGVEIKVTSVLDAQQEEARLRLRFATARPEWEVLFEAVPTPSGFRLTWSASLAAPTIGIAWALRPHGPWYGQGERVIQTWPLDRTSHVSDPFMPYDNSPDGTLDIASPVWFNARGAGMVLDEPAGELAVTLGRDDDGLLRLIARAPEAPWQADFGAPAERLPAQLSVDVLLADTLPDVFTRALRLIGHPTSAPPEALFAEPIWTTWAQYKAAITQVQVIEFAEAIVTRNYPRSVMEIDDRWQTAYGAAEFDQTKFPDPQAMVARLHELGFKVTLWVPPFFDPRGAAFAEAAQHGFLLRHPATDAPYLVRWWQGYGGVIDVSNAAALDWWRAGLQRLQQEYGIDGFKFDGGEGNFMPSDARTATPMSRRAYADRYVAWVAEHFEWCEVRTGWRSQRHGLFFREWDKWSRWGLDNGLHSVLTQALTLSLIGYPFVLPDMIGGNAYAGEHPDRELMIRWTQLTALLPAMQFSIPPWLYDTETDALCRRFAVLHTELAPYIDSLIKQTLRDGTPLVRPLFWHAPDDTTAMMIDDQFLLGDLLLVAPVVAAGQRSRNIYLPAGRWRDRWNGAVVEGPRWLEDYPAPLETLPLFERLA